MVAIGASARLMVVFSGINKSPRPPPLGNVCGIVPSHCQGHQEVSKVDTFCIIVLFAVALAAAGAIQSE